MEFRKFVLFFKFLDCQSAIMELQPNGKYKLTKPLKCESLEESKCPPMKDIIQKTTKEDLLKLKDIPLSPYPRTDFKFPEFPEFKNK